MRKKTLTVFEMKALFIARFNAEQSHHEKLQEKLRRELGNEVKEEKPEAIAIMKRFVDWFSGVLARRLKQNRRTTPLISSGDFDQFVFLLINEISKVEGDKPEAEELKMIEKYLKSLGENIFKSVCAVIPSDKNQYDEYWRWITTVLDLAAERDVLPTELFTLEGATDEITRRMFTEEQYAALYKQEVSRFVDADHMKEIYLRPMLDMFIDIEDDEEDRHELERGMEEIVMPQLRATIEKAKVIIDALFDEEVKRIYG